MAALQVEVVPPAGSFQGIAYSLLLQLPFGSFSGQNAPVLNNTMSYLSPGNSLHPPGPPDPLDTEALASPGLPQACGATPGHGLE